jgi:putative NADH-flavin reductase
MNVIVFGAGGKTGSLVVDKAIAAGHNVTVFLHAPREMPAGVRVIIGDAGDPMAVFKAISGQDAVIDAIGGKTPYKETDLETTAARNIVEAMQAEHVRRLIVVSMMGIGDSKEQAPFWYEHILLPTFLRGADKDKTAMEATVSDSGLDFVIARPPLLTEDPATGSVMIVPRDSKGHKITRADLAAFLVEQLTGDQYLGQAVVVANS